jgi:hypothetical protein
VRRQNANPFQQLGVFLASGQDSLEHLDFAIKEFREMKMQPSLERALRQKKILKA